MLALASVSSAAAGPHEDARAADNREDYATELKIVQPEADRGVAWAQNLLGNMYWQGAGVPKDEAKALGLFRASANQGYPGGQINLGQFYENGIVVGEDPARASTLYRQAGEQGDKEGWALLKRICDASELASRSDCARIPAGTKAEKAYPGLGKVKLSTWVGILLPIILILASISCFFIFRNRIDISKRMRVVIGVSLIVISIILIAISSGADPDPLGKTAGFSFWIGVLFLFWSRTDRPFWTPLMKQTGVLLSRLLIFSALGTATILCAMLATVGKDATFRIPLLVLAAIFGVSTVVFVIWMLVLWVRRLGRAVSTPRPIPSTAGGERLRRVLFWMRALGAVALWACAIVEAIAGHPVFAIVLATLGALFGIGAYRTRNRKAQPQSAE